MSLLNVRNVIGFPSEPCIDEILDTDTVDIISPFYSGWALRKLQVRSWSRIRLITRLPTQYHSAPPFLDNDPKPLKRAMDRLGSALFVFAFPTVHAKLYITPDQAWLGSANFTRNGFSGKGELLLRIAPSETNLSQTFQTFLRASKKVSRADIIFLDDCVSLGLTTVNPLQRVAGGSGGSGDTSVLTAMSYDDFGNGLETQADAQYIRDRILNKNRMSGHVYSGFHGIFAFILKNPELGRNLLRRRRSDDSEILDKLGDFVRRYGARFGGPRGGTWNSKLSTRIGGTQSGGGAGDVVVKHLLPIVA